MGLTAVGLYMVLLGFAAIITPGVGIAGALLGLFPQPVTEFSHVPAYGLLTWLLTSGLRRREWPKPMALLVGIVLPMVFGLWMEVLQGFVPGRVVDIGDVALNGLGITIAALLIVAVDERGHSAPSARALGSG